jgi:hypothetical protein
MISSLASTVLVAVGALSLASTEEPVRLAAGVSPNGVFEIALEADYDTPGYQAYELKGSDDQFPAILVLNRRTTRPVLRVPWPGDPNASSMSPLRGRARVLWRGDSAAVAVNIREPHYWYTVVLMRDGPKGSFVNVPLPDFEIIAGRPAPDSNDLRARGVEEALRWTEAGQLVYYIGLSAMRPVSQPLTYRATLLVSAKGCTVVAREPVEPDPGR